MAGKSRLLMIRKWVRTMSSKLHKIPHFNTYDDIRTEMQSDLQYRLADRTDKTSLGRPLYYRINAQLILT